jgi:hypothetical protein
MSEAIPYLSVSKLNTFVKCGLQAKYRYLDHIPEPSLGVFHVGIVTHAVIERALRGVLLGKGSPSLADMTDWIKPEWDDAIKESEEKKSFCGWKWDEDDSPEKGLRDIPGMVKMWHGEILPKLKPTLVEHGFNFELDSKCGPFKIYGFLDLMEESGLLTDWKTANGSVSANAKKLDLQFPGYSWFAREYTKQEVTQCRKVFLVRGRNRIEQVPYTVDQRHRDWFARVAAAVWQSIEADSFIPNTSGWWCAENWCSFWQGCQGELK